MQDDRSLARQLGTLVCRYRQAAGLTQRQLADAAAMSLGAVRDLEQGRTACPQPRSVARLATALDLGQRQRDELLAAWAAAGPGIGWQNGPGEGQAGRSAAGIRGLRLCVLGPLAAWSGGVQVAVGTARQRAVLGLLAVHPGAGVHRDAIVDALWGGDPPASAVTIVQSHLSRLRHALDPDRPRRAGHGVIACDSMRYRLHDGVQYDTGEFTELASGAAAAAAAGDLAGACAQYEQALGLWRGEPLADVDVLRAHPAVVALALQRGAAVIAYAEAAAAAGGHDRAIGHLRALTAREPLHEKAHALLMTALAGTGQQAAALAVFEDLRRRLDAELGVPPGPELAGTHLEVLRQAVPVASAGNGAGRPAHAKTAHPRDPAPRQLPAAVPGFAGRAGELAALAGLLDQAAAAGGTVVISAIGGTAGVGKTALAVHWAHQAASRFPDGQLYADLQGFGPAGTPVTSAEAVRLFLDNLGVTPGRLPAGQDAQASLYRSLLAGRRMLIFLDNARDPQQVRPLLPGGPGCLVVITSRNQLTGLAVAEGAQLLTLDVMTEAESRDLLIRRLGAGRVAAEPAAAGELIRLCAGLPLALAIAAARAVLLPGLPLAALAAGLSDTRARLDGLSTGDAATDVRTVFSWSCQQLGEPAARMFRLLGVHPGPDITAAAAASLAGTSLPAAGQVLRELARAHLISEHSPGRYAFHDLLRAYAAEQAPRQDGEAGCRAALHRVLDHYLHTARAASLLLSYRDLVTLDPPQPGTRIEQLAGRSQALAWFQAERPVLLAAVSQAAAGGFGRLGWQLPWAMATFLGLRGYWREVEATQRSALTAARNLGDRAGQAQAHRYLGKALGCRGAYAEASTHLAAALELGRQLGSLDLQARIRLDLVWAAGPQGPDQLSQAEQALGLYRAAGQRQGEAEALNIVGWQHAQLGRYQEALDYCGQALALHRELADSLSAAATLDSLGYAHYHLGHHGEAIDCYQQAISIHGEAGDLGNLAEMLSHLGDAQQAAGDRESARRGWQRALAILDDLDHPDTEQVREKLVKLEMSSTGPAS